MNWKRPGGEEIVEGATERLMQPLCCTAPAYLPKAKGHSFHLCQTSMPPNRPKPLLCTVYKTQLKGGDEATKENFLLALLS